MLNPNFALLNLSFSIVFYSPITLIQTGQTNKHTHKHKSSFNNIDVTETI